jgi:hypothetical protein
MFPVAFIALIAFYMKPAKLKVLAFDRIKKGFVFDLKDSTRNLIVQSVFLCDTLINFLPLSVVSCCVFI